MLFDQGSLSYFGSLFRRRPASLPPKCTPLLTTFFFFFLSLTRTRLLCAPVSSPSRVEVNSDVLSRFNCGRLPSEIRTKLGHFAVAQISLASTLSSRR